MGAAQRHYPVRRPSGITHEDHPVGPARGTTQWDYPMGPPNGITVGLPVGTTKWGCPRGLTDGTAQRTTTHGTARGDYRPTRIQRQDKLATGPGQDIGPRGPTGAKARTGRNIAGLRARTGCKAPGTPAHRVPGPRAKGHGRGPRVRARALTATKDRAARMGYARA